MQNYIWEFNYWTRHNWQKVNSFSAICCLAVYWATTATKTPPASIRLQEKIIFSTSHRIPRIAIFIFLEPFIFFSASREGEWTKKQQKVIQKAMCAVKNAISLAQILLCAFFFNFHSFLVSYKALVILQEAKRAHPWKSLPKHLKYYFHKDIMTPLLWECGLFIPTCVSKKLIVSKDLIFSLFWYNVIRWSSHICKNLLFPIL